MFVSVTRKMSSGEGDRITLRVKQLSGEEKTITTSLTSTIAELRPIISEVTGIPSDSLRMIFRGRLLQDANTVTQSRKYSFPCFNQFSIV